MNLAPTYLMNFELNEWIEDKTDVLLAKQMFNFVVTMCVVSYF